MEHGIWGRNERDEQVCYAIWVIFSSLGLSCFLFHLERRSIGLRAKPHLEPWRNEHPHRQFRNLEHVQLRLVEQRRQRDQLDEQQQRNGRLRRPAVERPARSPFGGSLTMNALVVNTPGSGTYTLSSGTINLAGTIAHDQHERDLGHDRFDLDWDRRADHERHGPAGPYRH